MSLDDHVHVIRPISYRERTLLRIISIVKLDDVPLLLRRNSAGDHGLRQEDNFVKLIGLTLVLKNFREQLTLNDDLVTLVGLLHLLDRNLGEVILSKNQNFLLLVDHPG